MINELRQKINELKTSDNKYIISAVDDAICVIFPLDHTNELDGGLGDDLTIRDIAKKHGVSEDFITDQLSMGINVEMEHTDDPYKSIEISMDHLYEIPDYYTRLDKMEKSAGLTEAIKGKKEKRKKMQDESTFFLSQLAGNLFMMD